MAGTTTYMTWQHRISAFELEKRFGLRGIESYIAERAPRWLGCTGTVSVSVVKVNSSFYCLYRRYMYISSCMHTHNS